MEIVSWVLANFGVISSVLLGLLSVASLVTKLTPSPKDDRVVARIQQVVGWLFNMRRGSYGATPPAVVADNPDLLLRDRAPKDRN